MPCLAPRWRPSRRPSRRRRPSDGRDTVMISKFFIERPVLAQNRVSAALAALPTPVQAQGVVVQKKSTSILEIVALTSPDQRYDSLFMSNYATINLVNELARVPGVGNVNVLGVGQYSMRI